jgi:hypothetical protein
MALLPPENFIRSTSDISKTYLTDPKRCEITHK